MNRRRVSNLALALIGALLASSYEPAAVYSDAADCCVPIALVALEVEVTTYKFRCCCPERGCEEREGEAVHRFTGFTYEYACGERVDCEDPAAVECGEVGVKTDLEHESTVGQDWSTCECVASGCWLMPPECLDLNSYFSCICTVPPYCILTATGPGCLETEPGEGDSD